MQIRDLEDWRAYCDGLAPKSVDRDRGILATGWGGGTITPPPALEDPLARIPLERAQALEELAGEADPGRARRHLELALDWLKHPHPRSSRSLLDAMRQRREALRERLQELPGDSWSAGR